MMIALSNGYHVGKVNDLPPTNSCNYEAEEACGIDMNLPICGTLLGGSSQDL